MAASTIDKYITVLTNVVEDPPHLEDAPSEPYSLKDLALQRKRLHWLSVRIRDALKKYEDIWEGSTSKKAELFSQWTFRWDGIYKLCREHIYTDEQVAATIMERFSVYGTNRLGCFYVRLTPHPYLACISRRPKMETPTKEEIEQDKASLVLLLAAAHTIVVEYFGAFYEELKRDE